MTRTEAIHFYTVKQGRASSMESKRAYSFIISIIETEREPLYQLQWNAKNSASSTRRAIYKKALRELNI